jgi:hypothetical protein
LTSDVYYYVQPAWADQPIAVLEQEIAAVGYRSADEAPLSLLPAETLVNRRLIGQAEPWLANQSRGGGPLSGSGLEADIGIAAHSESAIAFELPAAARSLQLAVSLDRDVGQRGCVRCQVRADHDRGEILWDSGVFQGCDGLRNTGPINVAGVSRIVLVTQAAHEDRPPGADPLDIRDDVVWLAPLVKLDFSMSGAAGRLAAMLPGVADWELTSEAWKTAQLGSRWNVQSSMWDTVVTLPKGSELTLRRPLHVTHENDVVELMTVCPVDLDEHDFTLSVNGAPLIWTTNTDRNQLRQWMLRYGRTRRETDDQSPQSELLAYWWDLQAWRGQDVTLELTLRGSRDRNEIAWRGLSVRSAIGNLPASGQPLAADVPLVSLAPLTMIDRDRTQPLKDAIPKTRQGEPIRFLGQRFTGGYGLARNSSVSFALQPQYKAFVAVAGCAYQTAGPVAVLIDDRVVWERSVLNSLEPAEQLEITIPAGAKKLTLQSGPEGLYYGFAAFASAGFVTK